MIFKNRTDSRVKFAGLALRWLIALALAPAIAVAGPADTAEKSGAAVIATPTPTPSPTPKPGMKKMEPSILLPVMTEAGAPLGKAEDVVAAIFVEHARGPLPPGTDYKKAMLPSVVFMLYADGTAVRSLDLIEGGAPYHSAKLGKTAVGAMLAKVRDKAYFENKSLGVPRFGFDSGYTTIYLRDGGKYIQMRSWHELFADNKKSVVTSNGVEALNGRDPAKVKRDDKQEYRDYLRDWENIKNTLMGMIPESRAEASPATEVAGTKFMKLP